ncbi:MAG: flavin reductase [Clostridia bacterium]|nr:flavin reductase [Clostridia bacterium]
MKERINVFDYAEQITKMLPEGILLNTCGDKFNSMVIGWGHLGVIWGLPTFTVYVRQSRYTREQLDRTREFTVSAPTEGRLGKEVFRICGSESGRDVDKEKAAHLTLAAPQVIRTPGILEYPLTLECRVLYRQDQVITEMPEEIRKKYYTRLPDPDDFHTAYIGEIVSAYIIRGD